MSASQDRSVILWNPLLDKYIKIYKGIHNYEILDVAIASDNDKFVSVGGDKTVFVWDVKTGKILRKFSGHVAAINTV